MGNSFRDVLPDDESLSQFLKAMGDFDKAFCDLMVDGVDFTLKLEVRGNKGELVHCKVDSNHWRRPKGVEKRIDRKSQQNRQNSPL